LPVPLARARARARRTPSESREACVSGADLGTGRAEAWVRSTRGGAEEQPAALAETRTPRALLPRKQASQPEGSKQFAGSNFKAKIVPSDASVQLRKPSTYTKRKMVGSTSRKQLRYVRAHE